MSQQAAAQIGKPAPAERALDADNEAGSKGSDELEKRLWAGENVAAGDDLLGGIEHTGNHHPRVQIDAAKELELLVVLLRHGLLSREGREPVGVNQVHALTFTHRLRASNTLGHAPPHGGSHDEYQHVSPGPAGSFWLLERFVRDECVAVVRARFGRSARRPGERDRSAIRTLAK